LNSIAPLVGGGFATIDLNTGDVRSYGIELEGVVRPTPNWTLSGGLTLMSARLTDFSAYTALTGRILASDRIPFQPDWTVAINSDYVVPLGDGELVFNAGVTGKGTRVAASLSQTVAPILDDYFLVNGAVSYRNGPFELTAFVNNALQADYFDSYIEKTTLQLAGIPASDVAIIGDRRRYGVRARFRF
jgi:iron complex outermembrane receptor protein